MAKRKKTKKKAKMKEKETKMPKEEVVEENKTEQEVKKQEELIKVDEKNKQEKHPKEVSQETIKKIFKNIAYAVGIMIYFMILNLACYAMKQERLVEDIKVFAGAFLVVGILFLERAYQKEDEKIAVTGVEFLVLSLHSLSIMHVITLFQYDFKVYLLTSSYLIAIYYVLKAIIIYTKERKNYLNSLSDISEIVKKEEPSKKEAKKRRKEEVGQKND